VGIRWSWTQVELNSSAGDSATSCRRPRSRCCRPVSMRRWRSSSGSGRSGRGGGRPDRAVHTGNPGGVRLTRAGSHLPFSLFASPVTRLRNGGAVSCFSTNRRFSGISGNRQTRGNIVRSHSWSHCRPFCDYHPGLPWDKYFLTAMFTAAAAGGISQAVGFIVGPKIAAIIQIPVMVIAMAVLLLPIWHFIDDPFSMNSR
jgi:hypothetical protein